jgi:hypothetical protein
MPDRISHKADELAAQLNMAAIAVQANPNWPPAALVHFPELQTRALAMTAKRSEMLAAEAAFRTRQQELRAMIDPGRLAMSRVDETTDALFGPSGTEKLDYGLSPKSGPPGEAAGEPEKVVIREVRDGAEAASLFVDWESVARASYQVEWFTDSALTQKVGSMTVTPSETTLLGLTAGKQYWIRIRAVRAARNGPWSDPATRVANL